MKDAKSDQITMEVRERSFLNACESGDLEQVKHLRKQEVNINCKRKNINYARPGIILAIINRHEHIVFYLIDAGCDVNICDANGTTPLMEASRLAMLEVMERLDKAGANIYAQDVNGNLASMYACRSRNVKAIAYYAERYEDIFAFRTLQMSTHLLIALGYPEKNGCNSVASYIISTGKEAIYAKDRDGKDALDWAVTNDSYVVLDELITMEIGKERSDLLWNVKSVPCAKVLINHGVDFNDIGEYHQTILFRSTRNSHKIEEELYDYYLTLDCDINKCDTNGDSALTYSLDNIWNREYIIKLVEKGADVITPRRGRRVLDIIKSTKYYQSDKGLVRFIKKTVREQRRKNRKKDKKRIF